MMKVGFIGTGSMGSILIQAFIRSGALSPDHIIASNRTHSKAEILESEYPGLRAVHSNVEIAINCNLIFICVKPLEFKSVIDQIRNLVVPEQILVSITSPVQIKHLENQLSCKIAKIIPSITNSECSGASLCIFGPRITLSDRQSLEQLFAHISTPICIDESHTRVTSDLSSCGPAFLAFYIQLFIDAAVHETGITRSQATQLASAMALGTGKLLTSGGYTPESLQERVTVPGGITAEGLRILSEELGDVFLKVIRATHHKYDEDVEKLEALLHGQQVD